MAKKTSCIRHRAEDVCVVLRADYLELLDGNACAASVLAVLEYWTNWKIDHPQYIQRDLDDADAIWIYKTMADLVEKDLLGSFGQYAVRKALQTLEERGYISSRRTEFGGSKEYKLNVPRIQSDIDELNAQTRSRATARNRAPTARNRASTTRNRASTTRNRASTTRNRASTTRNRAHTESTTESTEQSRHTETTTTATTESLPPVAAVAVDPANLLEVRELLHEYGITRNGTTAFLYENPPDAARVRAAIKAAQRATGLKNPIGQAIRWLKDGAELPPSPYERYASAPPPPRVAPEPLSPEEQLWQDVLEQLRLQLSQAFRWFNGCALASYADNVFVVKVSTAAAKEMLETRLAPHVKRVVQSTVGKDARAEFIVDGGGDDEDEIGR